jgi:hypothetical protein
VPAGQGQGPLPGAGKAIITSWAGFGRRWQLFGVAGGHEGHPLRCCHGCAHINGPAPAVSVQGGRPALGANARDMLQGRLRVAAGPDSAGSNGGGGICCVGVVFVAGSRVGTAQLAGLVAGLATELGHHARQQTHCALFVRYCQAHPMMLLWVGWGEAHSRGQASQLLGVVRARRRGKRHTRWRS